MRKLTKRDISPEYPRIPHVDKNISNMTHDDIQIESDLAFPFTSYVQEKIDGSNMGVTWGDGPVLRNRNHILNKGYIKNTPSKIQFRSAWNWLHSHEKDIKKISEVLMSNITIYGEWMYFKHSIYYDKLPDYFIAYDIYIAEDDKFLSPDRFEEVISKTSIRYIKPKLVTFNSIGDIIEMSERSSDYKDGMCEGIVIKGSQGTFKVVNKYFERRDDFNELIIKNEVNEKL